MNKTMNNTSKTTKLLKGIKTIVIILLIVIVGFICLNELFIVFESFLPNEIQYMVNDDQRTCVVTGAEYSNRMIITIPKEIDGYTVVEIAPGAFKNYKMQVVILPDSIVKIGDSAFYSCKNLGRIHGIQACNSLVSIGESAFERCQSLTSMKLPNNIEVIGERAFYGCTMWFNAIIPQSVQQIGNLAYAACFATKEIHIPKSVKTIGNMAFYGCEKLTNIFVEDENPYWSSVDGVLYDKEVKTLYSYPSGRKNEVFMIPEGVENIYYRAFAFNMNLTEITLPSTIKAIGEEVFITAERFKVKIETVNYNGTVEMWQAIDKPKNWGQYSSDFIIVCTDGQIAKDGTVTYN